MNEDNVGRPKNRLGWANKRVPVQYSAHPKLSSSKLTNLFYYRISFFLLWVEKGSAGGSQVGLRYTFWNLRYTIRLGLRALSFTYAIYVGIFLRFAVRLLGGRINGWNEFTGQLPEWPDAELMKYTKILLSIQVELHEHVHMCRYFQYLFVCIFLFFFQNFDALIIHELFLAILSCFALVPPTA